MIPVLCLLWQFELEKLLADITDNGMYNTCAPEPLCMSGIQSWHLAHIRLRAEQSHHICVPSSCHRPRTHPQAPLCWNNSQTSMA